MSREATTLAPSPRPVTGRSRRNDPPVRPTRIMGAMFVLAGVMLGALGWTLASGAAMAEEITPAELALCLSEKGWVMYGSITCSACRAQRKAFGAAFAEIEEVECNPYAPNTQVELCLEREIATTPTWIREANGAELERIEGYQLLEDLAEATGCDAAPG